MKKALSLLLVLCLVFTFCSCGKKSDGKMEVFANTGIEIDASAFPKKTVLNVETVEETSEKYTTAKTALPKALEIFAYEITAESKGVLIQPDGSVAVNFPLPETYDSEKHDVAIYYVADDGTTELITSSVADGKITATLTHFSTYVVVLLNKETADEPDVSSEVTTNVSSKDSTSSKESTTSKPAASSNPTPSSKPAATKPTSSATVVKAPTLSEATVKAMTQKFLNAGRWAYGFTTDEGIFYNKSDFKDMDPIAIEDFIFKYNRDAFTPFETFEDGFYKYTVSYDFMTKLSKEILGLSYDFKKSTTGDLVLQFKYNAADNTITILEGGGGAGDIDGYIYRSFSQSNDTCTVNVSFRTYAEEKPTGKENVDWIVENMYGEDCYFTLSRPATVTLKYVDGNWVFKSFLPK